MQIAKALERYRKYVFGCPKVRSYDQNGQIPLIYSILDGTNLTKESLFIIYDPHDNGKNCRMTMDYLKNRFEVHHVLDFRAFLDHDQLKTILDNTKDIIFCLI